MGRGGVQRRRNVARGGHGAQVAREGGVFRRQTGEACVSHARGAHFPDGSPDEGDGCHIRRGVCHHRVVDAIIGAVVCTISGWCVPYQGGVCHIRAVCAISG
eukprot:534679-Prymnesium_polylepis.1